MLVFAFALSGCGGHNVYRGEEFGPESPFRFRFAVSPEAACEAARLALLGQGYVVADLQALDTVEAKKEFQPDDEHNVVLEFHVVCKGVEGGAMVFASATQSEYELKKTRGATSLSVPSAGSISLPWGKTTESLIKVASKTIDDADFYRRFFVAVEWEIKGRGIR
jgi:hypothetical protein